MPLGVTTRSPRPLRCLDLFCGTKSIGNAFEAEGFEVVTLDNEAWTKATHVVDILTWDYKQYPPGYFDVIWASPPCQGFSVARIGTNWTPDHQPKTDLARLGVQLVARTLEVVDYLKPRFFFMENPMGKLRKLPVVAHLPRVCLWYCRYGDERAKPTDIWYWEMPETFPVRTCHPYKYDAAGEIVDRHCHHEVARRGDKTGGTQASHRSPRLRAIIPAELCTLLAQACRHSLEASR